MDHLPHAQAVFTTKHLRHRQGFILVVTPPGQQGSCSKGFGIQRRQMAVKSQPAVEAHAWRCRRTVDALRHACAAAGIAMHTCSQEAS